VPVDNAVINSKAIDASQPGAGVIAGGGAPRPAVTPPPSALPAPADRVVGQRYPTPRGPMTWNGTGWVP